jgi:hypothetical protein
MPPTPNILHPPADVVTEVSALRAAVEQVVPLKQKDRNLLIGTWNLRAFGDLHKDWRSAKNATPKRNLRDVHAIAAIVSHFDVVAVQEVRGNIRALRYLLRVLGDEAAAAVTTGENRGVLAPATVAGTGRTSDVSPVYAPFAFPGILDTHDPLSYAESQ